MADLSILVPGAHPLAVSCDYAAALMSVSNRHFVKQVDAGVFPQPRRIGSRTVWLMSELLEAVARLPADGAADDVANPWDGVTWQS